MAIFRVERDNNYSVISNYHLKEKDMSLKAKGLLSEMLSLKEDWDYSSRGLSSINKESKDTINRILQELEDFGYLERNPIKNENGCFLDWEYIIYEKPLNSPCIKNPDMENPDMENEYNNKILNNKELKNNFNKKKSREKKKSAKSLNGNLTENNFKKPTIHEIKLFLDSVTKEIYEFNKTVPDDKKKRLPTFTAEKFYYYYESIDWYVGKKKMKNWKAAVRRWINNDFSVSKKESGKEQAVPEWFDKKLENEPMTSEEQQELDDILNSISSDSSG